MKPGKYKTARKEPKPKDMGNAPYYVALLLIVLIGYSIWASQHIFMNRQAVLIGKSVDCVERPSFDYFAFCNGLRDGAACTYESRSRMMEFYEPIDYACAKTEPPKQFRFPVYQDVEYVEG